ncbi:MAG: LysE family transporter [Candidatus Odinarchaeota archaeon]|nr:LysE family transporter [Candidatus Odinarchaeota archaeon]
MITPSFILKVVVVTSSGALSPGPLTFSTINEGAEGGWKSGLMISIGHTIVEFPLVVLIALGLTSFLTEFIKKVISVSGGFFLIFLSYLTLKELFKELDETSYRTMVKSPLSIGILLSALNPYFLTWWIFVGGSLAIEAYYLGGFLGILIMFSSHVWMDYVWLVTIAYLSSKGRKVVNYRGYRIILALISVLILIFGLDLIFYGLTDERFINI